MPWPYFAGLEEREIEAAWAWLQTVPVRPAGNR